MEKSSRQQIRIGTVLRPVVCLNLMHQERGACLPRALIVGPLELPNSDHYTVLVAQLRELPALRDPVSGACVEALFQPGFRLDG